MEARQVARSKYGVRTDALGKAARTWNGVTYRSLSEYRYARHLARLQRQGSTLREWNPKPEPWPLVVNGARVGSYRPDFELVWNRGCGYTETEWVEVKGVSVRDWTLREKLVRALYPNRRLIVVAAKDVPKF